ncbi:MAG: DUF805 domain-containing protein [Planctomycetota bacterium]|jgi:uncharacterized membrane protein YhaH (DUF805 family)
MFWYIESLKKYADFSGRAHRKEFWIFYLSHFIIVFLMGFFASLCSGLLYNVNIEVLGLILYLYAAAVLIPSLAVLVRRLHDTGRSGWWFFLSFVPVGDIVLLIFLVQGSQQGDNQYGPNPNEDNYIYGGYMH